MHSSVGRVKVDLGCSALMHNSVGRVKVDLGCSEFNAQPSW